MRSLLPVGLLGPPPSGLSRRCDDLTLHNAQSTGTAVGARRSPEPTQRRPDIMQTGGNRSPGLFGGLGQPHRSSGRRHTQGHRAGLGQGPREHAQQPPGPAPTRRGQPPAPGAHPRIADVHNGGGARGSQRIVKAQSAAAALRSDAGTAGAGTGARLAGRWRKGRCVPGRPPAGSARPPGPSSRPLGQCAGQASARGGPMRAAGQRGAGLGAGRAWGRGRRCLGAGAGPSLGAAAPVPRAHRHAHSRRWSRLSLYSAPRRAGVGTGGGVGAGRLSRAPSISSHMARHRGTWKQPAGGGGQVVRAGGSREAQPLRPRRPPLTFERTSLDGEGHLALSAQVAKPFPVLGIAKLE